MKSNNLLHNDSIMSKLSEKLLSPSIMTESIFGASDGTQYKRKPKIQLIDVPKELHDGEKVKALRDKIT